MAPLNAKWDGLPEEYAALRRGWLESRRANYICSYLEQLKEGSNILEIGSGTGNLLCRLAASFPKLCFWGIEPQSSYSLFAASQAAEEHLSNVHFVTCYAEDLELHVPSQISFDWVISNDVLHHVQNLSKVASSLRKRVYDSANWLAIEPNVLNPYVFLRQAIKTGERNFWPGRARRMLRQHGWELQGRDYIFIIPPGYSHPPHFIVRAEPYLERVAFLAGGVALRYELRSIN